MSTSNRCSGRSGRGLALGVRRGDWWHPAPALESEVVFRSNCWSVRSFGWWKRMWNKCLKRMEELNWFMERTMETFTEQFKWLWKKWENTLWHLSRTHRHFNGMMLKNDICRLELRKRSCNNLGNVQLSELRWFWSMPSSFAAWDQTHSESLDGLTNGLSKPIFQRLVSTQAISRTTPRTKQLGLIPVIGWKITKHV